MEDAKIVELFFARSEDAVSETEKKYGRYCHYIAGQVLSSDEDAREIVNDTWLRLWNTIPPERPVSLKSYIGTICRNLAINAWNAGHAQKRGEVTLVLDELAECIPAGNSGETIGESLALREALNGFLEKLPQKTRNIFLRRYYYAASVAEIAGSFAMKESTVAMLLLRTRRKLKEYLEKEGFLL